MKIEMKTKRFGEVAIGEVFKIDTTFYMRIKELVISSAYQNAINLQTTELVWFSFDTRVQPVESKLVITG